mgnify:CR=1 FL=1
MLGNVAIVGRPNVGKSTLFNRIIGERLSITDDRAGVTRDRIYGESEWCGRKFVLIDTGGIEPKTDSMILQKMREQAQIAIDTADAIIFMCDINAGLVADEELNENNILPEAFDPRVADVVSAAVKALI